MTHPLPPSVRALVHDGLTWWEITGAEDAAVRWLEHEHGLHPLAIEDIRSRRRQRAKLDRYDHYLFAVLHVPRRDPGSGRIIAAELNVVLGDGVLITINKDPTGEIDALFARCLASTHLRDELMGQGPARLLYEIADRALDGCFPLVDEIARGLDDVEERIFTGLDDAVVREISDLKQEIITFRKSIGPQRPVLRMLERQVARQADLAPYFDELIDTSERLWETLENYKEVAEALEATAEAVTTRRLNAMLALLTIVSAILLPLTLVTGIYGMNIDGLPLAHAGPWSLLVPLGAMLLVAGGIVWYFRRRRWL